jgi:ABC-2 type transport system permease protein
MSSHSHTARFAVALLTTTLKASLMLRGAFVLQVVFMALNNITFFLFWWLLMRRVPVIRGWTLSDVQLLFGIVAAAYGLAVTVAGGFRDLGRLIDEGELDTLLVQPQPVLLHAWGLRSQASGFGDLLSGLGFIIWSGHVSWSTMPRVGLIVATSALLLIASGTAFFSLAFWLGRVDTLSWHLWELLVTFSLYPEPLFGGVMRLVLFTVIPAGWVGWVPVRLIQEMSLGTGLLFAVAACVYMLIAIVVFSLGLRRYNSGSRFATFG